jgi:hypothetical protein
VEMQSAVRAEVEAAAVMTSDQNVRALSRSWGRSTEDRTAHFELETIEPSGDRSEGVTNKT